VKISFEFAGGSRREMALWSRSLAERAEDSHLFARTLLADMRERLRTFAGKPPEATPLPNRPFPTWCWRYNRWLWIVYQIDDEYAGWLGRLFGKFKRTIRFLHFLDHPPENHDRVDP
jgi:hypothetical protein